MPSIRGLMTVCVSPVAVVAFCAAICGALTLSLLTELHQQLWRSR